MSEDYDPEGIADLIDVFGLADSSLRKVPKVESSTSIQELAHPVLRIPWQPAHSANVELAVAYPHALARLLEWSKGANGAHVVNHFCLQSRGITYSASIVHHRHDHLRIRQAKDAGPNAQALPLTTGETLHLPSTYTMLAHLLPRRDSQLSGRRIAELGAGLGLASSVLQQVEPAPSRLVVTDGDSEVLPLLCTNLEANRRTSHDGEPRKVVPECFRLLWGEPLPECDGADGSDVDEARPVTPLAAAFDLVLAADAVFSATPPKASGSRYECDTATASTVRALFATAASLLDPRASDPPARLVLTCEPRDRLKPSAADPLRALVPKLAEEAGFRCVEWAARRLIGTAQPDWLTDVLVFELVASRSPDIAAPDRTSSSAYTPDFLEWRGRCMARHGRRPEETRQSAA